MSANPQYRSLAYQNLSLAQQYSSHDPEVLLGMALFHQQVGEYTQAKTFYDVLMGQNKILGSTLIYYGRFLCDIGQYQDAQDYFHQAANLHQYQWKIEAIEQSAYCALNQGEQVLAMQQFSLLFSLVPTKRYSADKMRQYYQSQNQVEQVRLLNTILTE
ncbi:hypothetical protein RHO15_01330 [Utexia brackfieldae]|uniref:hypothetical protein n=1 Tax=Utexia brackfieldae TaxID=3074108 RepID=UPI00370D625F